LLLGIPQLGELLKQDPLTKIVLTIDHSAKSFDYHSNAIHKAESEKLMQSAVDMYQKIWPIFKHKFSPHTRERLSSPEDQFFSLTIQSWEGSIATGYCMNIFFEGRLTTYELDQNSFWEERRLARADGTTSSPPRTLHTVR
jgi:hypothetical protein